MSNKRICFIGDLRSIHIQKYIAWFIGKYDIFCITDYYCNDFIFDKNYIKIYYIPRKIKLPIIRHIVQIIKIRNIMKKENPDIINAQFITEDGWYAVFSGFRPVIINVYGSDLYLSPANSKFYRFLHKITLNKAMKIIVVSLHQKQEIKKYLRNINFKNVEVIQYGVNIDEQQEIDDRKCSSILRKYKIKKGAFIISSPRRLFPVYNIEIIIKGYFEFQKKIKDSQLLIIGDGPLSDKLRLLTKDLDLNKKVVFTDEIPPDEMKYFYYLSDIIVSIPSSDGMPLSVLEGMSMGKPFILSDLPSLNEIVTNNENGYIIDINDKILCDRLIDLFRNNKLRKEFGNANRNLIEKEFDYCKQMKKIEKIFLSTIDK